MSTDITTTKENAVTFGISGGSNTIYAGVQTVENKVENYYSFGNDKIALEEIYKPHSRAYMNLFVTDEDFLKGKFCIPKDRVMRRDETSEEIRTAHGRLSCDSVKELCMYPCLVIEKNKIANTCSSKDKVLFGLMKDASLLNNSVEIDFIPIMPINREILFAHRDALDLLATMACSELDEIHWAVKKVDVIDILEQNGVSNNFFHMIQGQ